jgi:outer membrane protein W
MKKVTLLLLFLTLPVAAQYNGKRWSITLNTVYTTSAKLYLDPNSADEILRNNAFPFQGIVSPQVEIRYKISDDIILGLSAEYMKTTSSGENLTAFSGISTVSILLQDGFLLIPVEFSGYYLIPFSTEQFKFLMGGGMGYYFGSQIRKFGDVEVTNVKRPAAYGIHVIVTMDYLITDYFSVKGEMKFRDPQFNVTSRYTKTDVNYNGTLIHLGQKEFDSKINVDGISFIFGLTYHF